MRGLPALAAVLVLAAVAGGADAQTEIPRCVGEPATIIGTNGPDTLTGTDGDDVIVGLGGDDVITGGGEGLATDLICGGDGNDTLNAGGGLIAGLSGDAGDDRLAPGTTALAIAVYLESPTAVTVDLGAGTATGWGNDSFTGVEGVIGSAFDDVLTGGTAGELLDGRSGNDRLAGAGGGDLLDGDAGNDVLDGGAGIDAASFTAAPSAVRVDLGRGTAVGWGSDRLLAIEGAAGSRRADVLVGSNGRNSLEGGAGNDSLTGLGGNDVLAGEAGNDRLAGGAGRDRLDGGAGRDRGDGGTGRDRCLRVERRRRCP